MAKKLGPQLSLPIGSHKQDLDRSRPKTPLPGQHQQPLALARRLPAEVRFGTAGWVYPDWAGSLWAGRPTADELWQRGLIEYCKHPLLRTLSLESNLDLATAERDLHQISEQLPKEFPCVMQVPLELTTPRLYRAAPDVGRHDPRHSGQANPHFLDGRMLTKEVLRPYRQGLLQPLAAIVLSFPPYLKRSGIGPGAFAARLDNLLASLSDAPPIGVELAEPEYLTLEYARVLATRNASHVFSSATGPLDAQLRAVPTGPLILVRFGHRALEPWTGREGEPCNRLGEPRRGLRGEIVELLARTRGRDALVIVDNSAEGCAPLTVVELARGLAERLG